MVETLLQELGEHIFDVLDKSKKGKKPLQTFESGVFLFFSFDLTGSTAFKAEHPSLWSSVFACFYNQILENLGVESYKTPNSDDDDSVCVRKLWKLIGDEVLIYVQIREVKQLYMQITNVSKTIDGLINRIAYKVKEEISQGEHCINHCQNVEEVVISILGIKSTAWLAECYSGITSNVSNITYSPMTTVFDDNRIDFLGKEIDEGFRIAKYAVKNKIIISPLLAWMIWRNSQENKDEEKIVKANFKIVSFVTMKGVWKNRKVPLVMFHQEFERFVEVLEYDELDLETYNNIKENGIKRFLSDERFEIERIDKIFENVHKKEEAEKLYQKLTSLSDIEMNSNNIIRKQEFHVACLIFDKNNRILIHKDADRGYEFGCIKRIFGNEIKNWKNICEEGYKEKYNIDIKVEECPVPIATYYYKNSNAIGLIVIADYEGELNKINDKNDWDFYEVDVLENNTEKAVDNFKENINRAVKLRKLEEL